MMPPNLTADQKDHIRIASRAGRRIEETWQIFNMFLSEGKSPKDALYLAQEAVSVWSEWMEANEVEFPDIERPGVEPAE